MTTDKEHLTNFIDKLGVQPKEATFNNNKRLIALDLSELGLRKLPPEIGRLRKTLTPDGNILWLCGEHRQVYEVAPLALETTGD